MINEIQNKMNILLMSNTYTVRLCQQATRLTITQRGQKVRLFSKKKSNQTTLYQLSE